MFYCPVNKKIIQYTRVKVNQIVFEKEADRGRESMKEAPESLAGPGSMHSITAQYHRHGKESQCCVFAMQGPGFSPERFEEALGQHQSIMLIKLSF